MSDPISFRRASAEDSRFIAEMVEISSDGIARIEWELEADPDNGVSALDVGAALYAGEDGDYSYRNCLVAQSGNRPVGSILAFPITDENRSRDARPPPYGADEIFAPYMFLEAVDSWYICGVTVIPEFRKQGIGEQLIRLSMQEAREAGYENLSLIAVGSKTSLIKYYESLGFRITRSAPIVPHPLIRVSGDAVLMETRPGA
jgi:ribosomal protein S18 acetylase RimI-like enzyme